MISIEGQIINTNGQSRKRVEIGDDGLIAGVLDATGTADLVLNEELIFPGFIDLHVHAREDVGHTQDYKEDFTTAGLAAINGGVTAFADMPNNPVPPVDEKSYFNKQQLAKKSEADVLLYAGIGPHTGPLAKKVPYKVFMGKSIGDLFFSSLSELETAIVKYRGQSVSFHCEQPEILAAYAKEISHEKQRPPEAEVLAIDFALQLIKKYELKGKICHCSTMEGLKKIIVAKKSGLPVTVEATPHHLYFDEENVTGINRKFLQVNPPIRQSKQNRLALIAALKAGDIDYLATDHAPHTIEEKEQGISGIPHLDTYGPFVAWLMAEHKFTPADIARVCANNPGVFIGKFMDAQYGKIEPGFVGSLTIMDLSKEIKVEKLMLKSKCGWSPFEGITFPGSVAYTIVMGKVYKH